MRDVAPSLYFWVKTLDDVLCNFPVIRIHVTRLESVENSGSSAKLRFIRIWVDAHAEDVHWATKFDRYHGNGVTASVMDAEKGVRLLLIELAFEEHYSEPWLGYVIVQAAQHHVVIACIRNW